MQPKETTFAVGASSHKTFPFACYRQGEACYTRIFANYKMMKVFLSFLATAGFAAAQGLFPGQAARLVIGQPNFTAQANGADQNQLGAPGGLAYVNGKLFVADANRFGAAPLHHRVLLFNNFGANLPAVTSEFPVSGARCPACIGTADAVIGQSDFISSDYSLKPTADTVRLPTAVASDGQRLAVADTDNNRILIWNSIPLTNKKAADVVIGQADFTSAKVFRPPNNKSLLGPQGVWFQGGKLYVADTQNHRVLVWNTIPTSNNKEADLVLGQANFNTAAELDLTKASIDPKNNNLLNPVSVSSDGVRLYVSDLGFNRVLIWNTIPTQSTQAADVVVGQPDFTSAISNNVAALCESTGTDDTTKALLYPPVCAKTIQYPRFALGDGKRLFIADGGNDRVLVYNTIPTTNGAKADLIIGQLNDNLNRSSDFQYPLLVGASDTLRTPSSLAWDGTNLFVSDTYNRRVLIFSLANQPLVYNAVRNSASLDVFAQGTITLTGSLRENDAITVTIDAVDYKYTIKKDDKMNDVILNLIKIINASVKPAVTARPFLDAAQIRLSALKGGLDGNTIQFSLATSPTDATITFTTSGASLNGGQDAAKIAPGTLITINGENLSDRTASTPADAKTLPLDLGNVQVYFDGIRAPLLYVSPSKINAQVPFEVSDASSISAYVRTKRDNGQITVTSPVGVPVVPQNPGIYAEAGIDPRPGVIMHYSSSATGTVSVDGSVKTGDVATITFEGARSYSYKVVDGDTLESIRDNLIKVINANTDETVTAFAAGVFTRIRLRYKKPGSDGNGITYATSTSDGAQVILTATTPALCCANTAGARVTKDNPALPGETIVVYATGLGLVQPDAANLATVTGSAYNGPLINRPNEFVSSLAGGKTANVLFAGLRTGVVGLYEIHLELNSDLPTDDFVELTIAQDVYVSNVVTFPVFNPNAGTVP